MLISVIIPLFNRESFIYRAVESVLNQTYKNLELLIIDDNSSDDSYFSIFNYISDKRITYYFLNQNRGVSFARNFGIGRAKGEFVAFLDSDDYWLADKLRQQVKFMIKNNIDISQTDELWFRKNRLVNPKKKHKKISGDIFEKSLDLCIVSPSAVMVKKNVFNRVGMFDENMPACEDYDLWLRISLCYKIGLLSEKLVVKRGGHDSQLSKMHSLDKYRIYSLIKLLKNNKLSENREKKVLHKLTEKLKIYINGCRKRAKNKESKYYSSILKQLLYHGNVDSFKIEEVSNKR